MRRSMVSARFAHLLHQESDTSGTDNSISDRQCSHEDKQQYYLPISPEFAGKLRTASRHRSSQRELTDYITQTKLLASLPSQAKAYPVLMPIGGEENGDLLVQTDAHVGPSAILAYPAAAVLFVVDSPVTVASTTVAILGVITSILLNGDIVH